MRNYTFYSFVSLIFITLVVFLGVFVYLISFAPDILSYLSNYIVTYPKVIKWIGINIFASGIFLYIIFYLFSRKNFYQVKLDPSVGYSLNSKYLHSYVQKFLEENIPNFKLPFKIICKKNKVEILTDFSNVPLKEHEALLKKIEPMLLEQIKSQFSSYKEFLFTIFCEKA